MPQRDYASMAREMAWTRQQGVCLGCERFLDHGMLHVKGYAELHHADGNPNNHRDENIELRHKACHVIPGRPWGDISTSTGGIAQNGSAPGNDHGEHGDQISVPPAVYVYVREGEQTDPHSAEQRRRRGYMDSDASPQMRAGAAGKPQFRAWLIDYLDRNGRLEKNEAVAAGAELTGMDITTIERWLIPMVSSQGPIEKEFTNSEWVLRLKAGQASADGTPGRQRPPRFVRANGTPGPRANGRPGSPNGESSRS
jgi:hypothetical protein